MKVGLKQGPILKPCAFSRTAPRAALPARSAPALSARQVCQAESSEQATAPAEVAGGRMTYNPPSFLDIVNDASAAALRAIADGKTRIEIEFPAVSGTESYKGSSDLYIDSNVQFAITAAKVFAAAGKNAVVLVPDEAEYDRSFRMFKSSLELTDGVSMSHLTQGRTSFLKGLNFLFDAQNKIAAPEVCKTADVHIVVNVTTNELAEVQNYESEIMKDGSALIVFNLELDTLRSDLGLFGFPSKDLQWSYLSTFTPAFYIRQRDYSKTVSVSPYLINYSGALFREYPGPWQVMLRQDNGEYACIAEDRERFTLGETKEELLDAMGLNTEAEGSTMQFLRRGYKVSTWWEEGEDQEKSDAWRT